jgi:hypothetical protein
LIQKAIFFFARPSTLLSKRRANDDVHDLVVLVLQRRGVARRLRARPHQKHAVSACSRVIV